MFFLAMLMDLVSGDNPVIIFIYHIKQA